MAGDHHPDGHHLRALTMTADHNGPTGLDSGGDNGAETGTAPAAKKNNHMIHLHLIPHIYVPVMHAAGYSETKNYHTTIIEDGSASSQAAGDLSTEFHNAGDAAGTGGTGSPQLGPSGAGENHPTDTGDVEDHGNFNGHSGELPFFTVSEDTAVRHPPEHFDNAVDNVHHDYEAPASTVSEEPHQYQVFVITSVSTIVDLCDRFRLSIPCAQLTFTEFGV